MTQTAVKLTRDGSAPTLRSAPGPRALAHTRARLRTARNGRPSLRIVPGRVATRQAWFAVGMLMTLVAGLLLTLLINTRLAEGTYTRNRLAIESSYLADRQEALTDELDAVRAPAALARQALALGMVPAASPAFISLAQSQVLGAADAAIAGSAFAVITAPTLPESAPAGGTPADSATPGGDGSAATDQAPAGQEKASAQSPASEQASSEQVPATGQDSPTGQTPATNQAPAQQNPGTDQNPATDETPGSQASATNPAGQSPGTEATEE